MGDTGKWRPLCKKRHRGERFWRRILGGLRKAQSEVWKHDWKKKKGERTGG